MDKKRIAVDQDQVLADLLGEWLYRYNNDYNDNLQKDQISTWDWHKLVKPECGKKIYSYLDDPDIFESLNVIDGSQEVVEELSERYEIFVVTAPWNINNVIPKYRWLKRHFPFIDERNYVFTRNKSIVGANWLIDDKVANFKGFNGISLLFDAPHNQTEKGYTRMLNWKMIRDYFHVRESLIG